MLSPKGSCSQNPLQGENHGISSEEADEVQRSNKRVKNNDWAREDEAGQPLKPPPPPPSYRDKVAGSLPGAYERAFMLESEYDDDTDDDVAPEEGNEIPSVLLTRKEKLEIRAPWRESLIVKLFGKALELSFFKQRLISLWKPTGEMTCVDVGHGFFVISFKEKTDRTKVLKDGPWFINGRFLTIRVWEPNFTPSKASFSAVALWLRIREMPLEYYNPRMIQRTAEQIGPLLRVDGYTALTERANFARLCVQLNLNKALPKAVRVGDRLLDLQYEGISTLCFECGIVGHRKEYCPNRQNQAPPPGDGEMESTTESREGMEEATQQETEKDKEYGPWTLVTNRKKYSGNRKLIGGGDRRNRSGQRHEQGHDVRDRQQTGRYPSQSILRGHHEQKEQRSNRTGLTAYRNDNVGIDGKGHWRPKQDRGGSKPVCPMDLDQRNEAQKANEPYVPCDRTREAHAINGPSTIDPLPSFPKLKSIENTILNPNSEIPSEISCRQLEVDGVKGQPNLRNKEPAAQSTNLQCEEMLDAAKPCKMGDSGDKVQLQGNPVGRDRSRSPKTNQRVGSTNLGSTGHLRNCSPARIREGRSGGGPDEERRPPSDCILSTEKNPGGSSNNSEEGTGGSRRLRKVLADARAGTEKAQIEGHP